MTSATSTNLPRVCVLTPAGRGAIAVVAVTGAGSMGAVDQFFHAASGKLFEEIPVGQIAFGRWGNASGEEVVVTRREHAIEIHCHGGVAASRAIVESLESHGCQVIDRRDWLAEQSDDPIAAAAHLAVGSALTERAALILLDQVNGALRRALKEVMVNLECGRAEEAKAQLFTLLDRRRLLRRLNEPARVVVTGTPNVGKSSLVNALVGYQRAIVFDTPGTTRDLVTTTTAIDGWGIELIDTAGLRRGADSVEQQGIELALDAISRADLVVHVGEASDWVSGKPPSNKFLSRLKGISMIEVASKVDRLDQADVRRLEKRASDKYFLTSATERLGIEDLLVAIAANVNPSDLPAGTPVLFNDEQFGKVTEAFFAPTVDAARQALLSLLSPSHR